MESVRIIYSQKENVAYCMWKYFFDSCGIWVISQTIEEYENSLEEKGETKEKKDRPTSVSYTHLTLPTRDIGLETRNRSRLHTTFL